jgi:peptidoglycan/LPS O-acetylase OafA/YrhL
MDTVLLIPTNSEIENFSPLLIVGWTLSFEWLFYALFFILILGKVKRKLLALLVLFIVLIASGQLVKPDDLRFQFITNPILLEFLLGVIICQLYKRINKIPAWIGITCLAAGLLSYILLIRFGYGYVWHYQGTIDGTASLNKFLLWGLPSAFIVAGCIFLEKNGYVHKLFDNKWSLLLGDASYSIYLIHYTFFNALHLVYKKTGHLLPADAMIWLQVIAGVGISLAFYKLVEKPLLKFTHKHKAFSNPTEKQNKKTDVQKEKIEPASALS